MLAAIHIAGSGLQVNNAPVSRRSAVSSALSAFVLAPTAAVAGGRFGDSGNNFYDTVGEYQATPTVPGFQYKAANL